MKKVLIGFVVLVLLVVGFVVFTVRSYVSETHGSPGAPGPSVTFTVHSGDTLSGLGPPLMNAGVISSPRDFKIWLRLSGSDLTLQQGDYDMRRHMAYSEIVNTLQRGPTVISDSLLIREGLTVTETATAAGGLKMAHIAPADFLAAATTATIAPTMPAPGATTLEGYLYPSTYFVDPKATAADVVRQMVTEFNREVAKLVWSSPPPGVTPYQVLIVASMIEREAKASSDGPMIASVIYNRLKAGIHLSIDATVYYAEQKPFTVKLTNSDLAFNSPYNTYVISGLPPTPIDSPQLSSIDAALHPANTADLYYVLSADCVHHSFFKTDAEFQAAAANQPTTC